MKRILALLMAMAMVFAFVACSSEGDSKTSGSNPVVADDADAKAVADYAAKVKESALAAFEGSGLEEVLAIDVFARGTDLVVQYKLIIDIPEDQLGDPDDLINTLEQNVGSIAQAKTEEPAISSIVVEVLLNNGKLFASTTL